MNVLYSIKNYIKRDPVLFASMLLATVSAFFVPPSPSYIGYLDLRVLSLLLSLMLVVAGFQKSGLFIFMTERLLRITHSVRSLSSVLLCLSFFCSMFITNDVALITFVPLSIIVLKETGQTRHMILIIVLQTIAANLGSMLTPLGNPQNLYLFSASGLSIAQFVKVMARPTAISLLLLIFATLILPRERISPSKDKAELCDIRPWIILFILCLLAVIHVLHYAIVLAIVILYVLIRDSAILKRADYGLLLTFVFFFIFIGNIKSIPEIRSWIESFVTGRETIVGILISQVISNVPAAMLLGGFTTDFPALLIGVNLGGLGTIIASMASLISYKLYCAEENAKKGRFLAIFTALNLAFLAVLLIFHVILAA